MYMYIFFLVLRPGTWFNIKMSSYQYRKSHCGDKMVVRSSYLHNGISYTGKMTSLYWIRAQVSSVNSMYCRCLGTLHLKTINNYDVYCLDNHVLVFHKEGFQIPLLSLSKKWWYIITSNNSTYKYYNVMVTVSWDIGHRLHPLLVMS